MIIDVVVMDSSSGVWKRTWMSLVACWVHVTVSSLEVEAALSDATGGLAAMVLGVPDPERDQVVAAVILAEPDTAPDLDALRTELRARLSAYKVPRRFLVLALSFGPPSPSLLLRSALVNLCWG